MSEHLRHKYSRQDIQAYFFGNPQKISEKILFIKKDDRLDEYKQHIQVIEEFGNVWEGFTGLLRGEDVTIIATGIGPTMVGDCVYSVDKVGAICLYSGTCGGIKIGEIGNYFLAEEAVCGDGFSLMMGYDFLARVKADSRVLKVTEKAFQSVGKRIIKGTSFTTSSVTRETDEDFWRMVPDDCAAIEMGCASFYSAALASSKKPVAFFWISDLPLGRKSFFDVLTEIDRNKKQNARELSVGTELQILGQV